MSVNISGVDGFLVFFACVCFLVASIAAWVSPGHRLVLALVSAGLLLWALTGIVH
jgi:hypothetical protein